MQNIRKVERVFVFVSVSVFKGKLKKGSRLKKKSSDDDSSDEMHGDPNSPEFPTEENKNTFWKTTSHTHFTDKRGRKIHKGY